MSRGPARRTAAGAARRGRRLLEVLDEGLPHGLRTIRYCGFELVHRRGSSLVARIREQGAYEPRITAAIVDALRSALGHVFVDVGANIGVISLAVLDAVPDALIYAFEPGPEQYELLRATVARNRLEARLVASPLALSDTPGAAEFRVHSTKHTAGDGFRDTGRAGRGRTVTVQADTLDGWWGRNGRPPLDVVKIDTEGSELLVLRGGSEAIAECRPTLFVEVHPENVQVYGYGVEDVLAYLDRLGYEVERLSRADVVARPR